jgi:enamine deaminase RidA (YjgF/YER057c/UK114 family)
MHSMTKLALEIPSNSEIFDGTRLLFENFGFSPAVSAGGLLFISGQVGLRPDGSIPETIEEQTECAFQRTQEILRLSGLDFSDLVEVVSYHVDMAANIQGFLSVKKVFTMKPYPAWSMVGIAALARPAFKIEIRSVAALRN